ncbi:hypothetical protein [Actinomadura rugatobispora]|uniref:Uncharacterized protein n=1 Tax=Actinomadura rugatobispora TaxID=1994 RepID=A0ABW1A7S5_9ACTN|nr:hypothetical protein GCM10010200_017340 [Actinomadura rugatobispora]
MGKLERPDVEIGASVEAEELVFRREPWTRVEHWAEPAGESASGSDRVNLPGRVEARVVYRDVRVDFRVAAALEG